MNKILLIISITIFSITLSCSIGQNDREQIISLVYNSQIGNKEHFGIAQPNHPYAPNHISLKKYESKEIAKRHLTSTEWIKYFEEEESYDSILFEWENRMKLLNRKIVLFGRSRFADIFLEDVRKYADVYGFSGKFLDTNRTWDKTDIQNQSSYEIINYGEFPEFRIDSIHVGSIVFSDVGFNKEKSRAIIYYQWGNRGGGGLGELIFLRKKENEWIIEELKTLWTS